jgi:hypothetical protein
VTPAADGALQRVAGCEDTIITGGGGGGGKNSVAIKNKKINSV